MTHRTSASTTSTYFKLKYSRRQTWAYQSRHRSSVSISRWYSLNQRKLERIPRRVMPCRDFHARRATISTLTNSTDYAWSAKPIVIEPPYAQSSIFHTQSLLFLFGFLFFPCWWIGGYYLKEPCEKDEEQTWVAVHPSLLANGRTSSNMLWISNVQNIKRSNMDEWILFYRWNRLMSLVSIGFLVLIAGLFIWYFIKI